MTVNGIKTGSASIWKDMEELSYINAMLPNAYNHFKDSLIKKGKSIWI